MKNKKPLVLSVVLPQFHPIPENDAWWGKGFTEWTNVVKGRPLLKGHHQPQLPADLGFYDMRLPEVRQQQASLATEYGIDGFCYYHYWFTGHRLLNQPVDAILASGAPDFPFCLCWANENWSRAWDGRDRELLMQQTYSPEDDEQHMRLLVNFFRDKRYIRIDGKPLFIVYKVKEMPDPARTFERWREIARQEGIGELCLAQFEAGGLGTAPDARQVGLDLTIEFAPDWRNLGGSYYSTRKAEIAMSLGLLPKVYKEHNVFDYRRMVAAACQKARPDYPYLRCVSPGFDNSARRPKNSTFLLHSTPENYEGWLREMLAWTQQNPPEHRVLFINAWNEWAEGNHLEPDTKHGLAYLEATRRALADYAP